MLPLERLDKFGCNEMHHILHQIPTNAGVRTAAEAKDFPLIFGIGTFPSFRNKFFGIGENAWVTMCEVVGIKYPVAFWDLKVAKVQLAFSHS